ncbi:hypothetical protein vseg_000301 [Gypsophila vaccaria]
MGNPKQKWTAEEEEALIDGIAKHGPGKWKCIQKDPQFHVHLSNRTNIDLKDKWRNMSTAAIQGSSTRFRSPRPKPALDALLLPAPSAHVPPEPVIKNVPAPAKNNNNDTTEMIFEALSVAKEQNGMEVGSIVSYIEQRLTIETPQNFRKQLVAKLRRLYNQGRLEKVDNCYKLKKRPLPETYMTPRKDMLLKPPLISTRRTMDESLEEAAKTAAYKVAEAEEKTYFAALSVREAERLAKMQEEADAIFNLAQEICDRCKCYD